MITITILSILTLNDDYGNPEQQIARFLITDGVATYYYSMAGIPLELDAVGVQTYLLENVDMLWMQAAAHSAPLTPEQIQAYLDALDVRGAKADEKIAVLDADIAFINISTITEVDPDGVPNALTGLKDGFRLTSFNPLSNADRWELIRITLFLLLGIVVDIAKSVKVLLKWSKQSSVVTMRSSQN